MGTFSWSACLMTEAEFKALMQAIDTALTAKGLKPFQRPLHVGRKLWEAFNWSGLIFPDQRLADQRGFGDDVLMAKAHRWYEQTYGNLLKDEWAYGFAPAR